MSTINKNVEDTPINPDLAEFERFPLNEPLEIIYCKPFQWIKEDIDTYTFFS